MSLVWPVKKLRCKSPLPSATAKFFLANTERSRSRSGFLFEDTFLNFDDFKEHPVPAVGGQIDNQDKTLVLPGGALIAKNVRFLPDAVETRYGMADTIERQQAAADPTGLAVLDVKGKVNPGQVPIIFSSLGELLQESPPGSGSVVALNPPFPLPTNALMQVAKGENTMFMAFSDGKQGLCPPIQYVGPQRRVSAISQNTIGALWKAGTRYVVGDLVRLPDGRWFRCNRDATGPASDNGPIWPQFYGYFLPGNFYNFIEVNDQPGGGSGWEEWTPACLAELPAPDISTFNAIVHNPGLGTIPAAKDVYIRIAWGLGLGESPLSAPINFSNTSANDQIQVFFNGGPFYGGPRIPRWMAEINLHPELFSPFFLNIYIASVVTGAPAPPDSAYHRYVGAQDPGTFLTINSVNAVALPFTSPAIINYQITGADAYIGEGGARYMMVLRQDREGSYVSVDPDSPLRVPFVGTTKAQISSIQRFISGLVTATVDDVTGFAVKESVSVSGVNDNSFDGQEVITGIAITIFPAGTISWQTGNFSAVLSSGGQISSGSGAAPVAFLPPSNPNFDLMDIAAFTVADASAGGPYSYIPAAIPKQTFKANMLSLVSDGTNAYATVDDASGIAAGNTLKIGGFTHNLTYLNQIVVVGSVNGPNISFAMTGAAVTLDAITGPTVTVLQALPTTSPASIQVMTSVTRDGRGVATAKLQDVGGFAIGQRTVINAFSVPDLNGVFRLVAVVLSEDGLTGTISWQTTGTATTLVNENATVTGVPDMVVNFFDALLADELNGADATPQLSMMPAPNASDAYFCQELRKMVYATGLDSKFYFSLDDDPANINRSTGGLSVNDNSETLAICVREMKSGDIIAIKEDGGYAVNPSDLPVAKWNCSRRWTEHGPPCAAMVAVGPQFIVFGSKAGAYMYVGGQLEWISEEYSGTWQRINWSYAHTGWCIIDEDAKEIHFGVPIDDATTPNAVLKVWYYGGLGSQEQENRYGKRYTARDARRWSMDTIPARVAAVVKRTLAAPQPSIGKQTYPFGSISRINSTVTALFLNPTVMPPVVPGLFISPTVPGHGSFNGVFQITGKTLTPVASLTWVQAPFLPSDIQELSWVNGASGNGLATVLFDGTPPVGVVNAPTPLTPSIGLIAGTAVVPLTWWVLITYNSPAGEGLPSPPALILVPPGNGVSVSNSGPNGGGATSFNVYIASGLGAGASLSNFHLAASNVALATAAQIPTFIPGAGVTLDQSIVLVGTGTGLDGTPYPVESITQVGNQYTVGFHFPQVLADTFDQGALGTGEFATSAANEVGGAGTVVIANLVDDPPADERITTRQVLYGLPGANAPWQSLNLISANRQVQLCGDGTTGGVASFVFAGLLVGNNAVVIIENCEGFDGVYDQPCTAPLGGDGVNTLLQFKTVGPDLNRNEGIIYSTISKLRVAMTVPDRYDDEHMGIDSQYKPAFFGNSGLSSSPPVLRYGGLRAEAAGAGTIDLQVVTEDDNNLVMDPIDYRLVPGKITHIEEKVRLDNEYATFVVTNKKKAGTWFSLRKLSMFANPLNWGKRG